MQRSHRMLLAATALLLAAPLALAQTGFALTSADLHAGARVATAQVYRGGGCHGGNQSPALAWHRAPAGTESYAITLFDPDAGGGHGWWHWLVTDIPASVHELATGAGDHTGALAHGAKQWRNSFGARAYGGPCPPPGDAAHHYVLTVYALDTTHLTLKVDANAATVKHAIDHHALAHATITARYAR